MSISKFVLFKFEEKPVDIGCVTWIKNPFDVEAINYFEKLEIRWPPAESSNDKHVVYKGKVLLVHSKRSVLETIKNYELKGKLRTNLLQELQTMPEGDLESRVESKSFRKEVMGRAADNEQKEARKETANRPSKSKSQIYKISQQQLSEEIEEVYPKQLGKMKHTTNVSPTVAPNRIDAEKSDQNHLSHTKDQASLVKTLNRTIETLMEENDTLKTHLSAVDELRKENSSLKEKLFALELLPDVVQYLKQATSSLSASSTPTAPIAIGGKGKALVNKAVRVEEVPQTDSDDSSDYSEFLFHASPSIGIRAQQLRSGITGKSQVTKVQSAPSTFDDPQQSVLQPLHYKSSETTVYDTLNSHVDYDSRPSSSASISRRRSIENEKDSEQPEAKRNRPAPSSPMKSDIVERDADDETPEPEEEFGEFPNLGEEFKKQLRKGILTNWSRFTNACVDAVWTKAHQAAHTRTGAPSRRGSSVTGGKALDEAKVKLIVDEVLGMGFVGVNKEDVLQKITEKLANAKKTALKKKQN